MIVASILSLPVVATLFVAFGPKTAAVAPRGEARVRARTTVVEQEPAAPPTALADAPSVPSALSPPVAADPAPARPIVAARDTFRVEARTFARTPAPPSMFVDQSASNVGYTPTGKALNVGPRGGVYHYSASGRKVYHSRKK